MVGNDLGGVREGELDVVRTDGVVPDIVPPWISGSWAIRKSFVDDILKRFVSMSLVSLRRRVFSNPVGAV